ncbi:MAG: hypothetical protein ACRDL7_12470 [Gaiellaceae bacterium]
MSEILDRADELRALAAKCATLQDFWKATGWRDVQAAHRANEVLKLGLPIISNSGRTGGPKVAQACPKPVGKGSKPKGGGE